MSELILGIESSCDETGVALVRTQPGGVPTLEAPGRRIVRTQAREGTLYADSRLEVKPVPIRAVPYALWGNRETGEMRVWLDADV